MPTTRATLAACAERLKAVTDTPVLEARLLAAHAWGLTRTQLHLAANEPCDEAALEPLITRRLAAEPVAYILGNWEFYSIELAVEAPLLVPRPETEHLVEAALNHIGRSTARVLDLCTGTGCVALAIALNARLSAIHATDCHPTALRVAAKNAKRHQVPLHLHLGDLFEALPRTTAPFDVIVSNPPYVAQDTWDTLAPDIRDFEDPGALLSGVDGLDCIRRIVKEAPDRLVQGGLLALEMGEEQGPAVKALLESRGFTDVAVIKDLAGHDRIATGLRA